MFNPDFQYLGQSYLSDQTNNTENQMSFSRQLTAHSQLVFQNFDDYQKQVANQFCRKILDQLRIQERKCWYLEQENQDIKRQLQITYHELIELKKSRLYEKQIKQSSYRSKLNEFGGNMAVRQELIKSKRNHQKSGNFNYFKNQRSQDYEDDGWNPQFQRQEARAFRNRKFINSDKQEFLVNQPESLMKLKRKIEQALQDINKVCSECEILKREYDQILDALFERYQQVNEELKILRNAQ